MIGEMISRVRNDKNVIKAELAKRTNINIGHITHIEKEERNPSHRALKTICRALEVPYQPLMYTYDKVFTDEQIQNKMPEHISYNKVLAVSSLDSFIECPFDLPSACLAVKVSDNSPLDNKDIGIFECDGKVIIRRYIVRKDAIVLRADNKNFSDIVLSEKINYNIIGKVIGTNTGLIF